DAEEVGEQDNRVLSLQAEMLELVGHSVSEMVAGNTFVEPEVSPQQIYDRAVGHGAAVRHVGGLDLQDAAPLEPLQELVEQTRLANARLAGDQHGGALSTSRPAVDTGQRKQLAIAADQRRQPTLSRHLQAGPAVDLADDRIRADWLALSLDLEVSQILED